MACNRKSQAAGAAARASGISKAASQKANLGGRTSYLEPPQVTVLAASKKVGRFSLGPLPGGFGVTLGNALRRALLASVKGAAVTSVKVAGVEHEFSTIPHVREDMTALILNLKQVRFKFKEDKPATLTLRAVGAGDARAGDLVCPPHVTVANPELVLFTADSAQAKVELEIAAQTGIGYSPSEEREPRERGTMPVDAIFSPVRRATFKVERAAVAEFARSGRSFERVSVEVTTDGALSPEAALRQAARTLAGHFALVAEAPFTPPNPVPANPYRRRLAHLGLEPRTLNSLTQAGLDDVNALMKRVRQGGIRKVRGLGQKSYADLMAVLERQPLSDEDKLILKYLRQGVSARTILETALQSGEYMGLGYELDEENKRVTIEAAATTSQQAERLRLLCLQLGAAGYEAVPGRVTPESLPFWQQMYAEALIGLDPAEGEQEERP